jgi:hypothetical protein
MEFCNKTNSYLLPYKLVPVGDEYFEGAGLFWADPDLKVAAHMFRSAKNGSRNQCRNEAVRYSDAAIGRIFYARRLRALWERDATSSW